MVKIITEGNTPFNGPWYLFDWKCPYCECEWHATEKSEVEYSAGVNYGQPEPTIARMRCPWCEEMVDHPRLTRAIIREGS